MEHEPHSDERERAIKESILGLIEQLPIGRRYDVLMRLASLYRPYSEEIDAENGTDPYES
jgi:hypothetical protein